MAEDEDTVEIKAIVVPTVVVADSKVVVATFKAQIVVDAKVAATKVTEVHFLEVVVVVSIQTLPCPRPAVTSHWSLKS